MCAIQFKKNVTTTLPRSEDESLLKAKLKRKLKYKVKEKNINLSILNIWRKLYRSKRKTMNRTEFTTFPHTFHSFYDSHGVLRSFVEF